MHLIFFFFLDKENMNDICFFLKIFLKYFTLSISLYYNFKVTRYLVIYYTIVLTLYDLNFYFSINFPDIT